MFCRNCGKEMSPTQAFCSSCGAKADNSPIQYAPPPVQNYNNAIPNQNIQYYTTVPNQPAATQVPREETIIKYISCKSAGVIKAITMLLLCFCLILSGIILKDISNDFEEFAPFFIIVGIISGVGAIIFYMLYEKRFCQVKTNSINGITCGSLDFINEKYELNFADIDTVWKSGFTQTITVRTKYSKEIKLFLPRNEIDYVYNLLKEHACGKYPPE